MIDGPHVPCSESPTERTAYPPSAGFTVNRQTSHEASCSECNPNKCIVCAAWDLIIKDHSQDCYCPLESTCPVQNCDRIRLAVFKEWIGREKERRILLENFFDCVHHVQDFISCDRQLCRTSRELIQHTSSCPHDRNCSSQRLVMEACENHQMTCEDRHCTVPFCQPRCMAQTIDMETALSSCTHPVQYKPLPLLCFNLKSGKGDVSHRIEACSNTSANANHCKIFSDLWNGICEFEIPGKQQAPTFCERNSAPEVLSLSEWSKLDFRKLESLEVRKSSSARKQPQEWRCDYNDKLYITQMERQFEWENADIDSDEAFIDVSWAADECRTCCSTESDPEESDTTDCGEYTSDNASPYTLEKVMMNEL